MSVRQAKETIAHVNDAFMKAFARHDAAAVAALYASGALLMPPHSEIINSATGIQKFWQGIMDLGTSASIETVEIQDAGDMAIEIGRYSITLSNGATADRGKYLVVWKQEGGEWRLFRDIWNSVLPAPPATT